MEVETAALLFVLELDLCLDLDSYFVVAAEQ